MVAGELPDALYRERETARRDDSVLMARYSAMAVLRWSLATAFTPGAVRQNQCRTFSTYDERRRVGPYE